MLNPGDLIFVRGPDYNVLDDFIKLGESIESKQPVGKCYSHVAVYIGANQIMEAQGFRKSGRADLSQYEGEYEIGIIDMTPTQRRLFLWWIYQENGLPYDWIGIWWIIVKIITGFDRHYQERRRRYCSKYVSWALAKAGIKVNGETPETLALDPRVRIVQIIKGG